MTTPHWVQDIHVDGFRFDLASILSRDESARLLEHPPILWDIDPDPALAGTKLIAEAWDAAACIRSGPLLATVGRNGQFRDDVRRFLKGDNGTVTHREGRHDGW